MDYKASTYQQVIDEVEQSVSSLCSLPSQVKKDKNKEIISNISYFNNLTDKIEDRRSKIQTFSYQYLAILLTVLGVVFKFKSDIPEMEYVTIALCLFIQILTTLIMIIWYDFQSKYHYPFLKIKNYSNQWKWFYYGNEHIQKINRNPLINIKVKESINSYFNGLKFFIDKYKAEDIDSELRNNILQLYLLQVHNYYKNKFYLQLLNIRKWGFYIVIVILLGYVIANLIIK